MNESRIRQAAHAFGISRPDIKLLTSGLIHNTYNVSGNKKSIVLQQINTAVFSEPGEIISNYLTIFDYLKDHPEVKIPEPVPTLQGLYLFTDEAGTVWRATQYMEDSYVESSTITSNQAQKVAGCFGAFSQALSSLKPEKLAVVLPGFHNLSWRFEQFVQAIASADPKRASNTQKIIENVQQRKQLVSFYESLTGNADFPLRIMHHDCKISNILFHQHTRNPVCVIDLDTVMPGYFFSDLGDLIRSVTGTVGETATDLHSLKIKESYYEAIVTGYTRGLGDQLTRAEKNVIHHAGLIMIYMQGIRFLTDYLNGDTYYKIAYPEQNFDRANNQFHLLLKLEEFLINKFNYPLPYQGTSG